MFRIVCERCSFVLYSGSRPKSVYDVLLKYGDRCPRCLKKFSVEPKKIVVEPRQNFISQG